VGNAGRLAEVFDRLHVTCGVSRIPYAWITQLSPGGVAVLPWMPDGQNGYQVRLTARGDGTATGTFHGPAGYMMLRAQRTGPTL
jgi:protein-L-isoaspartate O-methyltransferase